ncbi:ribonuclease P protein component [Cohnella nanjingensis]|uniref:Ribonuclease P protein component n=1 Tax=Cohnella nanjingensis TaxID=1387779 RepID=A0A7X0RVK1_9BACL|nr:ribonuclease P protein component [Cohnella nanjingensis]MBB6674405.1 ribonuclease P protein component [Cohnella nanjingensis]
MERKLRLRNREDFNRIYRQGRSFANSQFVVYWRRKPDPGLFRLGISASSKLGGAVVRNRMRRMIKEIVRLNASKIVEGTDMILIVRKPALSLPYIEMEKSILHVLRKAGLIKGSTPAPQQQNRRPGPHGRSGGGTRPKQDAPRASK